MKLLATVLLLFPVFVAQAQLDQFKLKPTQKQWEQGPLTWNDFQSKPTGNSGATSDLQYQLLYAPGKLKAADSVFFTYQVYGFTNCDLNWVLETEKSPLLLSYNQAKF